MYAKKLKLENNIYFRAACLEVSVEGVDGALRTFSTDPYLCALIRVYNQFFRTANPASPHLQDGVYQSFKKQQTYLPLLARPTGVPLVACDFPSVRADWQARGNTQSVSKI